MKFNKIISLTLLLTFFVSSNVFSQNKILKRLNFDAQYEFGKLRQKDFPNQEFINNYSPSWVDPLKDNFSYSEGWKCRVGYTIYKGASAGFTINNRQLHNRFLFETSGGNLYPIIIKNFSSYSNFILEQKNLSAGFFIAYNFKINENIQIKPMIDFNIYGKTKFTKMNIGNKEDIINLDVSKILNFYFIAEDTSIYRYLDLTTSFFSNKKVSPFQTYYLDLNLQIAFKVTKNIDFILQPSYRMNKGLLSGFFFNVTYYDFQEEKIFKQTVNNFGNNFNLGAGLSFKL